MADTLTLKWKTLTWISSLTMPKAENTTIAESRAWMAKSSKGPAFVVGSHAKLASVRDEQLAGVKVRRYVPEGVKPGVLVYFHGGGFVLGDLDSHDSPVRGLANATRREVVAVDYRLAPEHRYPAAVEDCLAVTKALAAQHRVVVCGDSAGGNLAAVMANRCAAEGVSLVAQVLLYPMTDGVTPRESHKQFAMGFFLTHASLRAFLDAYVPELPRRSEPDCSPFHAASLKGVVPGYVLLSGCDVLRDEGRAYANKLQSDGVETVLDEVPGVIHGFFSLQGISEGKAAMTRVAQWLAPRW